MKRFRSILTLFFLSLALVLGGCKRGPSSSYKKNKQIKKGKPIPCPIKDC